MKNKSKLIKKMQSSPIVIIKNKTTESVVTSSKDKAVSNLSKQPKRKK